MKKYTYGTSPDLTTVALMGPSLLWFSATTNYLHDCD